MRPGGLSGRMRPTERLRPLFAARILLLLPAAFLPAQTPPPRTPVVRSPGNAVWAATLADARRWAAAEKKFVFVEFGQKACGNCQRMDTLLYNAFEFEALLVPMVPVKVDIDLPDGQALATRFEIGEAPSVLITTPEARLVFLMQGFQNAQDFYSHAHRDLEKYRRFASRVDAQEVATLSAREALDTGHELFARSDSAAALPRLERVAKAPDATPAMREDALELAAAAELDLGRPEESRKTIEKLIASTKDPDREERAELFRAQIPLAEGKPAEALKLFEAFRKAHPQSRYAASVDAMIQRLSQARPQ